MHQSSYQHMVDLVQRYLASLRDKELRILDVGSCDVNGSYRPLFDMANWHYAGTDLCPGPNVDIVLPNPYSWSMKPDSFDLIVSGQTFEHTEFFWLTWLEMVRVLKPGGLIFLVAPSRGPEHRYPVDCWRFYPDGFSALAKYGKVDLLEVSTDWKPRSALRVVRSYMDASGRRLLRTVHLTTRLSSPRPDGTDSEWGDTVGVFRKPSS
jgi:SAM-dependent methyltransferase